MASAISAKSASGTLRSGVIFTDIVRRQTDLRSGAVAETDAITSAGSEPDPKGSKERLNTTPIVCICVIFIAVLAFIIFSVLGDRRQNKGNELAVLARNGEERRLPCVGIVG